MKELLRVMRYLRPYRLLSCGVILITILDAGATLLHPWPMVLLFDYALGQQPLPGSVAAILGPYGEDRISLLIIAALAILAVALLDNGLTVINNYISTRLEQRMVLDFRSDLFEHAQKLSLAYHDRSRAGGLIYAINFQGDAAAGLAMAVLPMAQSFLTILGMVWISFHIHPTLALMSLSVMPFLYFSVRYYMGHIESRLRQVKEMEGESLSIVHESMSMIRIIAAFGREPHEYRRFRDQGERALEARVKVTVRQTMFSLAVNMITATGTALVVGFGAYQVMQGGMTGGELLVVMSYMYAIYKPLESISYTIGALQDHKVSVRFAFDVLDTPLDINDAPDAIDVGRVRGDIEFKCVDFSYPGRADTLREISFKASAGQVIAVVGPTGAGKTTLMSLIPRFYERQAGQITIDGREISSLKVRSLRQQFGVVLQEPLLFSGSIYQNIRYGRLDASLDEIIAAAKAASAHDFILALPERYGTVIGERGVQLSGGERQRICVARAFLKDAPILILDEPTSSVDSRTESIILEALERLMVGRTTFMIAHRLSTIRHADLIIVLNQGKIEQLGTHDELMECDGLYKHMHDVQSGQKRRRIQAALQLEHLNIGTSN